MVYPTDTNIPQGSGDVNTRAGMPSETSEGVRCESRKDPSDMARNDRRRAAHRSRLRLRIDLHGTARSSGSSSAKSKPPDVAVLMSGGVDSSVAALLLRYQGVECAGVFLRLAESVAEMRAPDGADDARDVAAWLGIPFYILDFMDAFEKEVVDRFVSSYLRGDTPNPCIECNRRVKIGGFLGRAAAMGIARVATGHYARVSHGSEGGRHLLLKGMDDSKDQSYMLYALSQEQLARTIFPLGSLTKRESRELAEAHGLTNARKKDSQDICFVQDGDFRRFIEMRAKDVGCAKPGLIVDAKGKELGSHRGAFRYTLGQRKGLGVALGYPAYVIGKSVEDNIVIVGGEQELYAKTLYATGINLIAAGRLVGATRVEARSRYRQRARPATAWQTGADELRVSFDEPQRALTPGQAVVLYDGDVVIGGGTIARVV